MAIRTYDPKNVKIIAGGIPITGYADGSFVVISRNADAFTLYTGADGQSSRSKSNDRSGTITLTLAKTSLSNDFLSAFAEADELTNSGVFPIVVKDLSGTTTAFSDSAFIQKKPDWTGSKEIDESEWVIMCPDMDYVHGSAALTKPIGS